MTPPRYEIAPGCFADVPDNVVELRRRTLPLTHQQERLWRFLKSCERSPTFDEMCEHMGLRSKSGIGRLLDALEAKGFVHRDSCRARSVVALDPAIDLARFTTAELASEIARRLVQ